MTLHSPMQHMPLSASTNALALMQHITPVANAHELTYRAYNTICKHQCPCTHLCNICPQLRAPMPLHTPIQHMSVPVYPICEHQSSCAQAAYAPICEHQKMHPHSPIQHIPPSASTNAPASSCHSPESLTAVTVNPALVEPIPVVSTDLGTTLAAYLRN